MPIGSRWREYMLEDVARRRGSRRGHSGWFGDKRAERELETKSGKGEQDYREGDIGPTEDEKEPKKKKSREDI